MSNTIEFDVENLAPMRALPDGRVLHLYTQVFNWKLVVSPYRGSPTWDDGW